MPTDPPSLLFDRRRALGLLAGAGLATVVGCRSADGAPTAPTTGTADVSTAIPQETAGPFPGDGSNGPDVLTQDGVVRSDITSSFGDFSGTADGIPLAIDLTVVEAGTGSPRRGTAVYLWHCDREGRYSLYSDGVTDQNHLRGVQVADDDGHLAFTSIFPAAYQGRWPHIHFEVYGSEAAATSGGTPVTTSQLALPEDVCVEVYATEGYQSSVANLAGTSLGSDMVFSDMVFGDDGTAPQLATMSGSVDQGFTAALVVPV